MYCLPHAGGAASTYLPWARLSEAAGLEICPVELPGHGIRREEPPLSSMEAIVAALFDAQFADDHDLPFALFGHSMGALVAYAVAQRIADRGGAPPLVVLVSAARPPASPRAIDMSTMLDEELLDALVALGGTPTDLVDIRDLMRLMIPTLRADLRATREDITDGRPLACPIRAYGGSDDSLAGTAWLERWSHLTTRRFSMRTFAGGHFYLNANSRALVQDIASTVTQSASIRLRHLTPEPSCAG